MCAIQFIFFQGGAYQSRYLGFGLNNWLRFPSIATQLGGSPDSGLLAIRINSLCYIMLLFSTFSICFLFALRRKYSGILSIFFGIQMFVALIALNFVSLGELSGKLLTPVFLLGSYIGFLAIGTICAQRVKFFFWGTLISVLTLLRVKDFRIPLINQLNGAPYLFLILCAFIVSVIGLNAIWRSQTRDRDLPSHFGFNWLFVLLFLLPHISDLPSPPMLHNNYSMSGMFGDTNIRLCMEFIKEKTARDSVIATSLWSIPGSKDEKYFLTSLETARRTLLDGPTYGGGLAWPSIRYVEELKDLHTNFSNSLDPLLGNKLKALGADFFLLDTRVQTMDNRVFDFGDTDVSYTNPECSIIRL